MSSSATSHIVAAAAVLGCVAAVAWAGNMQRKLLAEQAEAARIRALREEERRGRTAAEKALREKSQDRASAEGYNMIPIGVMRTPFADRRGTPRQGTVAPHAEASLVLDRANIQAETLDSLGGFSHVWVLFVFHENTVGARKQPQGGGSSGCGGSGGVGGGKGPKSNTRAPFQAKITPPRLGRKVGVFSTRSPHRPNPIGLSVCRLLAVDLKAGVLSLGGVDLVDGTPILDIKPYTPYDSVPGCIVPDWVMPPVAGEVTSGLEVTFSPRAVAGLDALFPRGDGSGGGAMGGEQGSSGKKGDGKRIGGGGGGGGGFKGPLAHYGGRRGAFEGCVAEVLSQDPRSVLLKAAKDVEPFNLTVDGVHVTFEARVGKMLVTDVAVATRG